MADIVCVAPPFRYKKLDTAAPICPHLGISSCAAVWREAGYSVRILDVLAQNLVWEDIRKVLEAEQPKVLAMTSVTASFPTALDIMQKAKALDPDLITILGGPHVTNMPETANHDCIDYIIINEGEDSGLELVNVLLRGQGTLEKIGGIGFKENGRLVLTPPRPFIADLDRLPFLPYDLLPMGQYKNYATLDDGRPFFSFMTTRGCPFHCIFCDSAEVFGHKYRQMGVERVIKELQFMYYRHGIRHVYFQDDEFTINRRRVDQFCDAMLAAKMDLRWGGLARVSDLADGGDGFVEKMARAGCRELAFGTEVGYQEGLDLIKKKITLAQTREAMRLCRKYNILSSASFTMGYPWEKPEHIQQTIRFAKSIDADIYYFQVLIPYPAPNCTGWRRRKGSLSGTTGRTTSSTPSPARSRWFGRGT